MSKNIQKTQKYIKNSYLWFLVSGVMLLAAAILILSVESQTTSDFNNFYLQQHQQLNDLIDNSLGNENMFGVIMSDIGISLAISFKLFFILCITIPTAIILTCLGCLLWRSSKHIKGFCITNIIISAIALCCIIFSWLDNIFLQYFSYLLTTPTLPNIIAAISIIIIPLFLLITLIYSIYTLVYLKRTTQ